MADFTTDKTLPMSPEMRQLQELKRRKADGTTDNALSLVPNHLSFCIDNSSSMSAGFPDTLGYYVTDDQTRLVAARNAMRHQVSASDPKTTAYSLVVFNSYAETLVGKTTNYTQIQTANFRPMGSTDMAAGLEASLNQNPTRIILLSDGEPNGNCIPMDAINLARHRGVKIDTISIGGASDKIMREISELTGGTFTRCDNPEQLTNHFVMLEPRNYLQIEQKP